MFGSEFAVNGRGMWQPAHPGVLRTVPVLSLKILYWGPVRQNTWSPRKIWMIPTTVLHPADQLFLKAFSGRYVYVYLCNLGTRTIREMKCNSGHCATSPSVLLMTLQLSAQLLT